MMIGKAERDVMRMQEIVDVIVVPALVAKFEGVGIAARQHPRNDASRSRSLENCGGSWNSTTPTFGESALSRASISAIEFAQFSLSRFQWVMNFDAFHANRKVAGVCSRQAFTASSDGVR